MDHLRSVVIKATTLPDAWYQALVAVLDAGYIYPVGKGSFEGTERCEFDNIMIHIKYPGARPLVPEIPPGMGIPAPTNMEHVEQYLPYIMTNEKQPDETYTYGERLWGSKRRILYPRDQVQTVIDTFKEVGPGWNQGTMEVASPNDCGTEDPPCLRLIDCRLRYGALHFHLYFRSWDLWSGFSANLAALQLLKEYMAKQIGCADGNMIAYSKGLHIYGHSFEMAQVRTYYKQRAEANINADNK